MLKKQKINIKKKHLENKQEKVYQYSFAFFYHLCSIKCLLGYSLPSLCRPVSSTLGKNFDAERKLRELRKFCEIRASTLSRRVWGFRSTDWGKGEASYCPSSLDIEHYSWFNLTCYHPPRAIPRASPALRAPGWGIVWSGTVQGVGNGANQK